MELKRVVVTGLGAVTPVGNTPDEMWNNLINGVSGAAPITHFDTTNFKTKFACEVKNLNVNDFLDRKEARKMDRYTQLALIAAKQAVADCGWDLEQEDKDRIGVVFGVGIGGIMTFEDEITYYGVHREDGPKFNPFFIPKMIADIAAGQISIMYGFHGPNYITSSACASSSNALADAFNLIRLGKANAIVTGGAEAAICESGVGGFNAMHALSTRNDEPEKASRPFSASRDGFIMAEGAGCLILESLYTTDTYTIDNTNTVLVLSLQIHAAVFYSLLGSNQRQLSVAVHLTGLFAIKIVVYVEVLYLASKLSLEVSGIKACNRGCSALTSQQILPSFLDRITQWCYGTQSCYYYSF